MRCAVVAQQVEHFLGKEEVGSSSLLNSSIKKTDFERNLSFFISPLKIYRMLICQHFEYNTEMLICQYLSFTERYISLRNTWQAVPAPSSRAQFHIHPISRMNFCVNSYIVKKAKIIPAKYARNYLCHK